MNKIILLLICLFVANEKGWAQNKKKYDHEIKIESLFISPLKINLSSKTLFGEGVRGIPGEKHTSPILIKILGSEGSNIKFTVEREVALTGNKGDILMFKTHMKGGKISYVGGNYESILILQADRAFEIIELGGIFDLKGKEKSENYAGILNIIITYD